MAEYLIEKESDEQWVVTPDGAIIYVACNDGYVRSYDAATGQPIDEIYVGNDLDSITLTPDGAYLVVTLAGVFDETGSGIDYSANARLALIDPTSDPTFGGPTVDYYDVPVTGDERGIADVSVSDTYEVLISLHGVSGTYSSLVKLDLSTGTVAPVASVAGDGTALSLTQVGEYGMTLVGEIGQEDGEYSLMLGDYTFSSNAMYSTGAIDFNSGVEAVSGNDFDGFIAIYANGKLMVFDKEFFHLGTISHNDGMSGDIAALAFGADGSTLYALDNLTGTITSYSIVIGEFGPEFTETGTVALNELAIEVLPYGVEMAISPDGSQALLNTTMGLVSVELGSGSGGGGSGEVTQVTGTDGNDYLEGTSGAEEFSGLLGDDTYVVDNSGDVVIEDAGAGVDEVVTSLATYALPDNVEILQVIEGSDYVDTWDVTGNELANELYFDLVAYDSFLLTASGLGGDDFMDASYLFGYSGSYASWQVTLNGDSGDDYLVGSADGDNTLYGGADSDTLVVTGAGYNILDGGEGVDVMDAGGATYYVEFHVDDTNDVVIPGTGYDEWNGQPQNYLHVSADYYEAPDGIYDITFTGAYGTAQTVVGTDGLNHFRSMDGNDTAVGGDGNDYYYVSYTTTTIIEEAGGGYDRISYTGNMAFYMPLNVEEAYIYGSGGTIYGNEQDNFLITQGGTLYGGQGNDTYRAWETGTIVEYADEGVDTVTVNYSYTLLEHFENLSWRDNSSSNGFTLTGNDVANVITGSNGNETLHGLDGADILIADVAGEDPHASYHAHDVLFGGIGNDELHAVYGNDTLYGENGWDMLFSGEGNDTLDGGNGTDRASYAAAASGVTVSLAIAGAQDTGGAGIDTLVSIEQLAGSAFDDTLTAGDAVGIIFGGGGADAITGGASSDRLYGEAGNDMLTGGSGWDVLDGGEGDDQMFGGNGGDMFRGGAGNDTIHGEDGADRAYLGAGSDTAHGGADGDMFYGQGGDDTLLGEAGDDVLHGSNGRDTLEGGADNDTLNGGGQNDILSGGDGDDLLIGSWGSDVMTGGLGADIFQFETGHTSRWQGNADTITDFSQADGDVIDLSAIDAIAGGDDNAFTFIGDAAFSGSAGELQIYYKGEDTYVAGDANGDRAADFLIRIEGLVELTSVDFVL